MNVLIIDDETHSHEALTRLLVPAHQEVQVLAHAYNVEEGVNLARAHHPDLVFLDVEMPDGTGFDLLERIGKPSFYVIFITAHNKHAETAFRFGALDFLTKPIEPGLLGEAVSRAKERLNERFTMEQLRIALEAFYNAKEKKLPERIAIHTSKGMQLLPVEDILYLEADANYTDFHYVSLGKKRVLTASLNLKVYDEHFEPYATFMKVHRSYIVNLRMVDQYLKGDQVLVLRDGTQVGVSKTFKEEVEERLENV